MQWQYILHRFHNIIDIRLSQSKPLIDTEGGENLNLGLFLKTPLHFTPPKLYTYLLYAPCFQEHNDRKKAVQSDLLHDDPTRRPAPLFLHNFLLSGSSCPRRPLEAFRQPMKRMRTKNKKEYP
jgi:hypothetical protein